MEIKNGPITSEETDLAAHTLHLLSLWGLDKSEQLFRYSTTGDNSLLDIESFNIFGMAERLGEFVSFMGSILLNLLEAKWQATHTEIPL